MESDLSHNWGRTFPPLIPLPQVLLGREPECSPSGSFLNIFFLSMIPLPLIIGPRHNAITIPVGLGLSREFFLGGDGGGSSSLVGRQPGPAAACLDGSPVWPPVWRARAHPQKHRRQHTPRINSPQAPRSDQNFNFKRMMREYSSHIFCLVLKSSILDP